MKRKAFTLLEVVTAVAILAILMLLATLAYYKVIQNAKDKAFEATHETLVNAIMSYQLAYGAPPPVGNPVTVLAEFITNKDFKEKVIPGVGNVATHVLDSSITFTLEETRLVSEYPGYKGGGVGSESKLIYVFKY